jgi:serine/threonine protein kinase
LDEFNAVIDGKQALFESQQQHWMEAFAEAQDTEQNRMTDSYGSSSGNDGPRVFIQPTKLQYQIIRELGQGAFGRVCEIRQIPKGDSFAQKFLPAPRSDSGSRIRRQIRDRVINEVAMSKKLQHHHIASVILWTEEPNGFNLIMPIVGDCDLRTFLEVCINDDFPERQTKLLDHWFGCLITALKFAHQNSIKHNDLKPSNILIKDTRVYLADFGCARDLEGSQLSTSPEELITGTPVYWPPGLGTEGRAGDVFALGCVFSEMLTVRQGRSLADYQAARKVDEPDNPWAYRKSLVAVRRWLKNLPGTNRGIPKVLLEMILIMLKVDLNERKDATELRMLLDETLFCDSCL